MQRFFASHMVDEYRGVEVIFALVHDAVDLQLPL